MEHANENLMNLNEKTQKATKKGSTERKQMKMYES